MTNSTPFILRLRVAALLVSAVITALTTTGCTRGVRGQPADAAAGGAASPALRSVPGDSIGGRLAAAYDARDERLLLAIDRSVTWFESPRPRAVYPFGPLILDRDRARRSLVVMRELLVDSPDAASFAAEVARRFDVLESAGDDGDGRVLFTGYFAPEYAAARAPSDRYRFPLYAAPESDRRPWHTRREIEAGDLLRGREIAWLEDPLSVFLVQVNGSARLRLDDGSVMHVGYSGTNEHAYTSLGKLMVAEGLVPADEISMQTIRAVHDHDPAIVETLIALNDRFVFFREVQPAGWPVAALGMPLTAESSVATDKDVFPPGGLVLVDTTTTDDAGASRPFVRFLLDQDRGGAITGPGRADIFMGVGAAAGRAAGKQKSTGRMFYLLLKRPRATPERP